MATVDPTDALVAEAQKLLPTWNDKGPDVDARYARAVALFKDAALQGNEAAIEQLAEGLGGKETFDWAVVQAKRGDTGALVSALTDSDWPPEKGQSVLAAAHAGEAWAALAVGRVYRMGMRDNATGHLVATRDGAWGWLPGARSPDAEGARWIDQAVSAGWAEAQLSRALDVRHDDPKRALALVRDALRDGAVLTKSQRQLAARTWAKLLDDTDAPSAERRAAHESLAAQGEVDSMVWLGLDARANDPVRARGWLEAAVKRPSAEACRELAKLLEQGIGGAVDDARAKELYESAAELAGDAYARERLATKWGLSWYALTPAERARAQRSGALDGAAPRAHAKRAARPKPAASNKAAAKTKAKTKTTAAKKKSPAASKKAARPKPPAEKKARKAPRSSPRR